MVTGNNPRTLNDVCEFIVDCLHNTAPRQEEGFPSIRTPNVGRGRLILDGVYRVSEETYQVWTQRAVPEQDDLILAREAPAGNVAIIKNGHKVCLGQRTVHLRPDRTQVSPDFLCYYLLAPKHQALLLAGETGATAGHVNMRDIRRLPMTDLPPLMVQQKAGRLLADYDDLLENNTRRIRLLEESARLLYEEWFVRLRFPGHEHTPIQNGLPEGWQRTTAFEAMEILSGGTPKTKIAENWDGDIPFFTPKDSTDSAYVSHTEKTLTERGLNSCSSKLYPKGTLFITARGTVGKLNLAQRPMAMNQSCYALWAKDELPQKFLYCALKSGIEHFRAQAVGAVFDAIIRDTFTKIAFTIPENRLIKSFDDFVDPLFQQVENLLIQNQRLQQARDLLLPRLMNGEIAV